MYTFYIFMLFRVGVVTLTLELVGYWNYLVDMGGIALYYL